MKQPKPWFRASTRSWYVEHHLKQVRLGGHPEDAPPPRKSKSGWNAPPPILDAYYKLMAGGAAALPKPASLTVAIVCDLFLEHSKRHHAERTFEGYKSFLASFCLDHGRLAASDLKPFHVNRWIDSHTSWKGARRHAVIATKRAFSWAEQQGLLAASPLKTVKAERVKRRTRVLSPEEQAEILGAVRDKTFRQFLRAMIATGCRPSEVARVTAADVDLKAGVWVFQDHKTAKKTDKPRIVYLTADMVELTRELMAENPEGPLFRGPRLKSPYSRNAIRIRFRRLREKLPHIPHFVCYNLRATFATQALVRGVPVAQVSELLGHSDTTTVSKHYAVLASNVGHMRSAAERAVSSA